MYGRSKNEIVFPDLIVGNCLGGIEHTMKFKFAGMKPIGDFGYTTNNFYGGRCTEMLFIKEYGFYACKQKNENKIIGFYIHDPHIVTELGKKLIKEYYGSKTVIFANKGDLPVTKEDMKEREAAIKEAVAEGYDLDLISHMTALQIKDLIKVIRFEKSKAKAQEPDEQEDVEEVEETKPSQAKLPTAKTTGTRRTATKK